MYKRQDDNRTITYITLDKDKSDYSNGETFVSDCLKKAKGYEDKIDSSLIDKDNDGYIDNVTTVSYTHLDVYKRQNKIPFPLIIKDDFLFVFFLKSVVIVKRIIAL